MLKSGLIFTIFIYSSWKFSLFYYWSKCNTPDYASFCCFAKHRFISCTVQICELLFVFKTKIFNKQVGQKLCAATQKCNNALLCSYSGAHTCYSFFLKIVNACFVASKALVLVLVLLFFVFKIR